jgi:hypothetical protein
MWRTLVFIGVLAGSSAYAQEGGSKKEPASASSLAEARAEAQAKEQNRIQALSQRGLSGKYGPLLRAGKVPATSKSRSMQFNAAQVESASRVAAIDLVGLGFTAAEVTAYRDRNIDLFDVAYTLFQGVTSTPADHLLLADTVVIATAGEVVEGRTRTDGFLSATPFSVAKSLKGTRAAGDLVYLPRQSGPTPDGMYRSSSADIEVTPGKKYLLVLSKNWYEQRVAETKKQAESSFNAIPFLVYEVSADGSLFASPRPTLSGKAPKNIQSVEADLQRLSVKKGKAGDAS